ncbi:nuclear transport factor 2 family protein [Candidatus Leptofilum sp.]|uniref:nuclear transport factor 2 family protein n=1 Tax=Candidatus Leptofilum sp. TaxID=3241576 RepID=UPI003B5C3E7C
MTSKLTDDQFIQLMTQLANSWTTQNSQAALDCFTQDAIYMEPPNSQLYMGHEQLRPYFAALTPGTYMTFHNLCFNEATQVGMGEFSFGLLGKELADVGIAVVQIENGKIAHWREYHRKGPANFAEFIAHEGKEFEWHIGNYP